jgi:hypothetical protein
MGKNGSPNLGRSDATIFGCRPMAPAGRVAREKVRPGLIPAEPMPCIRQSSTRPCVEMRVRASSVQHLRRPSPEHALVSASQNHNVSACRLLGHAQAVGEFVNGPCHGPSCHAWRGCGNGANGPVRKGPPEAAIARSEHNIRNDGVGGSNPSCGTRQIIDFMLYFVRNL